MADLYTIWADKEGDISDIDWVNGMKSFFDHLIDEGKRRANTSPGFTPLFISVAANPSAQRSSHW